MNFRCQVECRILDNLLGILVNNKPIEIHYEYLSGSLIYKNNGSVPQQFSVNTSQYMESMVMKVSRFNQENYSLIITTNNDINNNIEYLIEERLLRILKLKWPEKEFLISHLDFDHSYSTYKRFI